MSDLTVYAEALISTVARAFYEDEAVCLIDVLIRDKFLRDDDMAPRLQLPAKRLRATLQFLTEEHLVRSETVDDLAQGGSQATKFYYLDYNRAVHSIRLRLHLLRKKLEKSELQARSSSFYLCPGYKSKRCNGRYTEEEAQQVLDHRSGLFLCQECAKNYENDPNAPPVETYTLQLVDNTKELKQAMDNLRRVNVQFSSKFIGNHQIRAGIYDLLQKVRGKGRAPITSNLPSENFALGIGSKRLAGTGRTAGIKAKKLELKGVAESAAQARSYLVGDGSRQSGEGDLVFLKNAMGSEIHFTVERGGGARAQLLATARRRRRKLMDAAASRVGASLPLYVLVEEARKRKAEEERQAKADNPSKKERSAPLVFLEDNIGRLGESTGESEPVHVTQDEEDDVMSDESEFVLSDDTDELRRLSEEQRLSTFQSQYKLQIDRQEGLLQLDETDPVTSPQREDEEDRSIIWEECELESRGFIPK
jgi:transcription initiation factor TFIIE subunit alpha